MNEKFRSLEVRNLSLPSYLCESFLAALMCTRIRPLFCMLPCMYSCMRSKMMLLSKGFIACTTLEWFAVGMDSSMDDKRRKLIVRKAVVLFWLTRLNAFPQPSQSHGKRRSSECDII